MRNTVYSRGKKKDKGSWLLVFKSWTD